MAAPLSGATPQTYRPPSNRGTGAATTREQAARNLIEKYGAGIMQPG